MAQSEPTGNPVVGLLQKLIDLLSRDIQLDQQEAPAEPGGDTPAMAPDGAPASFSVSVDAQRFAAMQQKNTELEAQVERYRTAVANAERETRVSKYNEKLGGDMKSTAEQLADLPEAQADALVEQFAALKAQANPDLFSERGSSMPGENVASDAQKFLNESARLADEKGIDIAEAYSLVAAEHPEWAADYRSKSGRKEKIS